MKRMVNQELIDYIQSLYDKGLLGVDYASNTLEVGGNLEVDGNLKINNLVDSNIDFTPDNAIFFITSNDVEFPTIISSYQAEHKMLVELVPVFADNYGGESGLLICNRLSNAVQTPYGFEIVSNQSVVIENDGQFNGQIRLMFADKETSPIFIDLIDIQINKEYSFMKMSKPKLINNEYQGLSIFINTTYQYTNNEESIANQAFKTITLSGMTDYNVAITSIDVENSSGTTIDGVIVSMPKWNGTAWDVTLYNLSGAAISDFKVNVTYHNILDN